MAQLWMWGGQIPEMPGYTQWCVCWFRREHQHRHGNYLANSQTSESICVLLADLPHWQLGQLLPISMPELSWDEMMDNLSINAVEDVGNKPLSRRSYSASRNRRFRSSGSE